MEIAELAPIVRNRIGMAAGWVGVGALVGLWVVARLGKLLYDICSHMFIDLTILIAASTIARSLYI